MARVCGVCIAQDGMFARSGTRRHLVLHLMRHGKNVLSLLFLLMEERPPARETHFRPKLAVAADATFGPSLVPVDVCAATPMLRDDPGVSF